MTKMMESEFKCICGLNVPMEYFDFIDIEKNPELREKIASREINSFICPRCGFKQSLTMRFTYFDSSLKLKVMVLPEQPAYEEKKILLNMRRNETGFTIETLVIFGWDNFLNLLFNIENGYGVIFKLSGYNNPKTNQIKHQ